MESEIGRRIEELDTPALLVDLDAMEANLRWAQDKADAAGVKLRPHTKTHRSPALARRQLERGARGITVAKLGEAEVMAGEGIGDIFVANEIVGAVKMERLLRLARRVRLAVGVDDPVQAEGYSAAFAAEPRPLELLIDVDTGDGRTGLPPGRQVVELARRIAALPGLRLRGIFTHDGHSYGAADAEGVRRIFLQSQREMLETAEELRRAGLGPEEISIGSTPSFLVSDTILPGITEIRPGTYIFLDAAQAGLLGDYGRCALTVLATVTNRPRPERVVLDTGTKALTAFVRGAGVCQTRGYGRLKRSPEVHLTGLSDEHGVFTAAAGDGYRIGDKLEIIPNHACPTCNLYEQMYGVRGGVVVEQWPVAARGRSR